MQPPFVSLDHVVSDRSAVTLVDLGNNSDGLSPVDAFENGHVPGATFVDLDRWLAAPASTAEGRHPLPTPEVFAEGMRQAGIAADGTIVAYDRVGGVFAARLVWMLRAVGVDAALLDGGLRAWTDRFNDDALESGPVHPTPAVFEARTIPAELIADFDEVTRFADAALRDESRAVILLDAREGFRFAGEAHPLDAVSVHIPGAVSLPCRENVDERGVLLPVDALRDRLAGVGVTVDTDVVSSCGSGVTACHNLLVLEQVGVGRGRLYPGSWSQWTANGRPVA